MIKASLVFFALYLFAASVRGNYLDKQIFMDLGQAEARYGVQTFVASSFRTGSTVERAKMAVSLVKKKVFVGMTPQQIKKELGNFTGYFFSDYIPAYLIEEGWEKGNDTWQLVFLLDDSGHVNEIRIHKNCCPKN